MDKNRLLVYLSKGHEIEFSYNEKAYFLTPDYSNQFAYFLEMEVSKGVWSRVFAGKINEILDYKFEGNCSFNSDINKFRFDYIL